MQKPYAGILRVIDLADPGLEIPRDQAAPFLERPDKASLDLGEGLSFTAPSSESIIPVKGGISVTGQLALRAAIEGTEMVFREPGTLTMLEPRGLPALFNRIMGESPHLHVRLVREIDESTRS